MLAPWKKSYEKPRQHIKKQRHYFANKVLFSQSFGFSSGHVWMWELDCEESWAPKNWCVWTVVLEESSRKTSVSALLTMLKPLTVWITRNCGKFWMGIPDHLTCLLRNLYAGQEATVRTGHGTTGWFQIGKGVRQGCILPPCLFNLYTEDIMRNAGLDEAQTGIRIAGRSINNLR